MRNSYVSYLIILLLAGSLILDVMPVLAQVNDGPFQVYNHVYQLRTGQEDEGGTDEHGWRVQSRFDAPASGYYSVGFGWDCNCCGSVGANAYLMNNVTAGGACITSAPQYLDFQLQGWEDDGGNRYFYDDNDDNNCGMGTVRDNYNFRADVPLTWINLGQHTVDCGGGCYFPCDNCNRDKYHAWIQNYYTVPNVTTISSNVSICQGQSTTLTSSPSGAGVTVYWYTSGGAYVGTGNSLSVSPGSTTTYHAYGQYAGTLSSCYRSVTVTVNPAITAGASTDINVCLTTIPGTANITGATATNNTGQSWTYTSISGTGSITSGSTTLNGAVFTATSNSGNGTLTLTATGSCPSASDSRNISWDRTPGAAAGADISSGCTGLSAIAMTGASMTGTGTTVTGTWSGGVGLGTWTQNTGTPASATFTPTTISGSFTATLTTAIAGGNCNGQTATDARIITWDGISAEAGGSLTSCGSGTITINGATVTGTSYSGVAWTYTPITGTGSITSGSTTLNAGVFTPVSASGSGTLTLTMTGSGTCNGTNPTDTRSIQWSTGPVADAGADVSICVNAAILMTGATGGGTTGNPTWTGGSGSGAWSGSGTNPAAYTFTPSVASGSFTATLTVVGTGACTGSTVTDTRVISWVVAPTSDAGNTINSCTGTSAITMTGATATGTYSSEVWSGSGGSWVQNANPALATFTPSTASGSTTATLLVTGNGACLGTNASDTRTINWGQITVTPGSAITSCGTNAIAMATSTVTGNFASVAWTGGGGTGSWTTTHPSDPALWVYTPTTTSGSFTATLTATGNAGCTSTNPSATRTITWNLAPVASAGANIQVCTGTSPINMTGATATGTFGSVGWAVTSGTGTGNFTGSGTNPATYVFTPTTPSGQLIVTLTVTGNGACTGTNPTSTRQITWSTNPVITSVLTTNVTDCNVANGGISINATGDATLEYSVDGGSNYFSYNDFLNLNDGVNYNIRVRDQYGCTTIYGSNPVVLGGLTPITSTVTVSSNVTCAGGINGTITLTGTTGGGGGPYQYTLQGTASDRWYEFTGTPYVIDSIPTGTYSVVIADIFGCQSVVYTRTITEPTELTFSSITVTNITGCGGTGTGGITAVGAGGTGTRNFYLNGTINSPATSGVWTGLVGGEYELTLTDGNGCSTLAQTTINAPWTVDAGNESTICLGSSTALSANIVGALPTTCATTTNCSSGCGMPAGYCTAQSSFSTDERITNVTFNGVSQGSAASLYTDYTGTLMTTVNRNTAYTISVTLAVGGTYTEYFRVWFDWNRNGVFTDAGENYLIFGGETGSGARSLSVTVPAGATLGETRMRVVVKYNSDIASSCGDFGTYGEVEDYRINIRDVSTFTPTASYSWSPGGATTLNPTVTPGTTTTYTITANDGCGCIQNATTTVNVSNLAANDNLTQVTCNGDDDGCVTVTTSNGVAPYLFKLGSTVKVYGGRMKPVVITNANGTLTNQPVKITSVAYTATMRADFGDIRFYDINFNELSYWIESYTLSGTAVVWVKIPSLVNGNTTIYMVFGNNTLSSESNGNNVFTFFDDFSFFNSAKWTQGTIAATTGTNWSYYGGELIGGNNRRTQTSVATFTGNHIAESRIIETAAAGNGFTTLGFFGATTNAFSILSHNGTNYARNDNAWPNYGALSQLNAWVRDYVRAIGTNSFQSRTREAGGAVSGTYNNSGLAAERIRIGARDDNDASFDQNFAARWDWMFVRPYAATEPTAVVGALVTPDNVFCSLAPGAYTLTAVDMGNCLRTVNFTITEPTVLSVSSTFTEVSCYGTNNGAINLTPTGGTPAYSYNWAGPSGYSYSGQDPTNIIAGIYSVSVADQNTCTANTSVNVTQQVPITVGYYTWKGTTNTLWQIDSNWDCRVPDQTSSIIIPAAPVGGNNPLITGGVIGECLRIRVMGSVADLLKIDTDAGSKLQIYEP
jgi:hypothetical protein